MFVRTELKMTLALPPNQFDCDLVDFTTRELNRKLANKVVHNVGLCLAVYDILDISDGVILPGDGSVHYRIHFRMVVFRPSINEILVGKVAKSTIAGTYVKLGDFFEDIFIPAKFHQSESEFKLDEAVWVWKYKQDGDGEVENTHELYMDIDQDIRVRVTDEWFEDCSSQDEDSTNAVENAANPYTIIATIDEPGLGLLSWWS